MDSRSFFRPSGGTGQNGLADTDLKNSASDNRKLQEFHEEEERMKLRMLQADAGLIQPKDILVTAERMDWMYHNPATAAQKKETEDYLLGKTLQTPDEREEMRKRLGVGTTAAGSLFLSSITAQNDDTLRRLREDPLFLIRQAEYKQRQLENSRKRVLATAAATLHRQEETNEEPSSKQPREKHRERRRSRDRHPHRKQSRSRSPRKPRSKHKKKEQRVSSTHCSRTRHDAPPRNCFSPKDLPPHNAAIDRKRQANLLQLSPSSSPASPRSSYSSRPPRLDRRPLQRHPPSQSTAEPLPFRSHRSTFASRRNRGSPPLASPTRPEARPRGRRSPSRKYSPEHCTTDSSSTFSPPFSRVNSSSPSSHLKRRLSVSPPSKIVKGPVRPLEWQNPDFIAQRHRKLRNAPPDPLSPASQRRAPSTESSPSSYGIRSASQESSSSNGSLGPPAPMSQSVRRLRESKGSVPFLWKSRSTVQQTPCPSSTREKKSCSPIPHSEPDDVFLSCKRHLETQDAHANHSKRAARQSQLEAMIQYGKEHEKEKALKLSHMEKVEQLQETIENQKRGTTLQSTHGEARFLQQATSDAYLQKESTTLEDRLKRYAYRRRKSLLERNELDDEVA